MDKYTTNTNDAATHNVCIDDLLTISRALHASFLDMFSWVRIRVDPRLKKKNWHVAVSEALWEEIIEHEKKAAAMAMKGAKE